MSTRTAFEQRIAAAEAGAITKSQLISDAWIATFIIPSATQPVAGSFDEVTPMTFTVDDVLYLAVFTDVERIGQLGDLTEYYVTLDGKDFFPRMPPGAGIVVNPGQIELSFQISPDVIRTAVEQLSQ